MDRYGLRDALLAAGQPPGSFQIPGVHESVPTPTDFWFLRPVTGTDRTGASPTGDTGWEIGAYERGRYDVRETLPTEADACRRLYAVLTGHPGAGGG